MNKTTTITDILDNVLKKVQIKVPQATSLIVERGLELKHGSTFYVALDLQEYTQKYGKDNWCIGKYRICYTIKNTSTKIFVSDFQLYEMPHCCGICVSTASRVAVDFQRLGIATELNKLRQEIAKGLGYTIILCTDCDKNIAQKKVLEKNGWSHIFKFTNKRTKNLLNISVKEL